MNKEEIINFIYYLEDKVDDVYKTEVQKSISRFVKKLWNKYSFHFLLKKVPLGRAARGRHTI